MIADARATTCPICSLAAVTEISDSGEWEVRCLNCSSVQLGLAVCEPPAAVDPDAPVALGFAFESGPPAAIEETRL